MKRRAILSCLILAWFSPVLFAQHEGHDPQAPPGAGEGEENGKKEEGKEEGREEGEGDESPVIKSTDEQEVTLEYQEWTAREKVLNKVEFQSLLSRQNFCFWRKVEVFDPQIPASYNLKGNAVEKILAPCAQQLVIDPGKSAAKLDKDGDGLGDDEWKLTSPKPLTKTFPCKYQTGLERDYHAEVISFTSFPWGKGNKEVVTEGFVYRMALRRACYMKGTVAGKDFYLIDENSNGVFNDYGVDAVVYGKSSAAVPLSRIMVLGDQWLTLEVPDDGVKLKVGKYAGDLGPFEIKANHPTGELQYCVFRHKTLPDVYLDLSDWITPAKGKRKSPVKSENKDAAKPGAGVPDGEWNLVDGVLLNGRDRESGQTCRMTGSHSPPTYIKKTAKKATVYKLGFPDKVERGDSPFDLEYYAAFLQEMGQEVLHISGFSEFRQIFIVGKVGGEKYHTFLPEPVLHRVEVYDASGRQRLGEMKTTVYGDDKTWTWQSVMYPDIRSQYWMTKQPGQELKVRVFLENTPFFGTLHSGTIPRVVERK